MKSWLKENWREIAGWVAIAFIFIPFFATRGFSNYSGVPTFESFEATVVLTILILSWLRLNRK